jgi:DNA segregation ATPase FtsK/SpoIIIE-like protein
LPELDQLHRHAREIFDHALSSVDPRAAVKRAINVNGPVVEIGGVCLDVSSRPIYAIAIGKAAAAMAKGLEEALRICVEMKRASTSVLQRRLRIGYGRAAAILDMMEREGLIGQADGSRPRPVLGRAYEMVAEWDEMGADV